jgi:hypothetical protein
MKSIAIRDLPTAVYATQAAGTLLTAVGAVGCTSSGLSTYLGGLMLVTGVAIATVALHVADGWQR